jgi:hypothetical protein
MQTTEKIKMPFAPLFDGSKRLVYGYEKNCISKFIIYSKKPFSTYSFTQYFSVLLLKLILMSDFPILHNSINQG